MVLGTVPLPAQAASSVTYPFTKSDAAKYDTTGRVTFNKTHAAPDWYHADWPYRQKITVNHEKVAGTLSAFPMLVKMTGEIVNKAQADGDDILFTEDDGKTKLYHEIEQFDGELVAWVLVPELSEREDTILYVYYGNSKVENQQDPTRVWDTNTYAGVWHMNQPLPASQRDRAGSYTATPQNLGTQEQGRSGGKVGPAVELDGTNDYLSHTLGLPKNSGTISHWVLADQIRNMAIVYESSGTVAGTFNGFGGASGGLEIMTGLLESGTGGTAYFLYEDGSSTEGVYRATLQFRGPLFQAGTWVHMAATWDRTGFAEVYVNGESIGYRTDMSARTFRNTTSTVRQFGRVGSGTADRHWDGLLDEVRISNVARSGAWIATEYNNQSGREDFLTVEPTVESYTDTPTLMLDTSQALAFATLSSFTPNGSGKVTWQLSPDAGTTWYFYSSDKGWKQANPDNADHRSTGEAMNDHVASFLQGSGTLLWRAYFEEATSTLDGLRIDYTTGAVKGIQTAPTFPTVFTLSSSLGQSINRLFSLANRRIPTFSEWQYWANRVLAGQKDTLPALLGAMQWQRLFGGGTTGTAQVAGISTAGPTVEIRNGTNRQGLAKRMLEKLTEAGYAAAAAANAQDFLRETSKVYAIDHEAYGTAQELADSLAIPLGLDLPAGEEQTIADILLMLGYDFKE
ncbi:MAG: DUF2341 domain-containing protein [Candidatus Andersenbacteria bacterium]|nr:DUF2341 domain-containing protein [Candidatus Andersenbacteria bacterium]